MASEQEKASTASVAGAEVEKALNHLIIARKESVEGAELDRINLAITATHKVIEPEADEGSPDVETGDPLAALVQRLRNVSDRERGELLELSAPAAGVSGRLVADAAGKLVGFPEDARAAALILAALGIVDEAEQVLGDDDV